MHSSTHMHRWRNYSQDFQTFSYLVSSSKFNPLGNGENRTSVEDLSSFLTAMDSCIAINKKASISLIKSSKWVFARVSFRMVHVKVKNISSLVPIHLVTLYSLRLKPDQREQLVSKVGFTIVCREINVEVEGGQWPLYVSRRIVLAEPNCSFQVSQSSLPVDFLSNNNTRFSNTTRRYSKESNSCSKFSSNDRTRETGGRNARGGSTADSGFDNIC